ncbi:MAG TPA: hypothetical protein LFW21_04090 [Rickettsia endosymbiont of Pyrocoelia pectoralis]|nr:hypothetical protein [Rickettsia endosymbiont of Pyrocoelia pectoralis]
MQQRRLDHGIQKTIKNNNNFSIFSWIPLQARGMTMVELNHATRPNKSRDASWESIYVSNTLKPYE